MWKSNMQLLVRIDNESRSFNFLHYIAIAEHSKKHSRKFVNIRIR